MVADSLSRRAVSLGSMAAISASERPLARDVQSLANSLVRLDLSSPDRVTAHVESSSASYDQIRRRQFEDPSLVELRERVVSGKFEWAEIDSDGVLWVHGRLAVAKVGVLIQTLLREAHSSRYSVHPGTARMYRDLRQLYWWQGMKSSIAAHVSRCLTCQQVKVEHRRPAGELLRLPIPLWKWENVTMDFIIGLPRSPKGHDQIWVIVDRMTKSAHFLATQTT